MHLQDTPIQLLLFPEQKRCARCKETKAAHDFTRRTSSVDGLHPYCRACSRAQQRDDRQRRALELPPEREQLRRQGLKRCPRCEEVKPLDQFHRYRGHKDGRVAYCKVCVLTQGAHIIAAQRTCPRCHLTKPATAFSRSRATRDGLQIYCKRCRAKDSAIYDRQEFMRANGLRRCVRCGEMLRRDDFRRLFSGHLSSYCVPCYRATQRDRYARDPQSFMLRANAYYHSHKEQVAAWGRAYHRANAARIRERQRRYAREHRDEQKAYHAAYYDRHRQRIQRRSKEWQARHPEQTRASRARARQKHKLRRLLDGHTRRVRQRENGGSCSPDELAQIRSAQRDRCAYCLIDLNGSGNIEHMTPVSKGGSGWAWNICLACPACDHAKYVKTAGAYLAVLVKQRRTQRRTQTTV